MQETDQRDQEQNEREQREQHLIGQRRGIGRHLVSDELRDGADHHTVQRQAFQIREKHSVSIRRNRVEARGGRLKGRSLHQSNLLGDLETVSRVATTRQ
ncbi:hypothetical protein D3C71_1592130 [compost metagenome]